MRFYEFQSGEVLLDGVDIREYPKEELRRNIGLVLQDPFLYHGTIKSNIKMYQDISDEAVQAAAAFVDADQFIQKLPEKYETDITAQLFFRILTNINAVKQNFSRLKFIKAHENIDNR